MWSAWIAAVALVLVATCGAGCGAARLVTRTDAGGTLVLEGFPVQARSKAHDTMTAQCRGPYTVVGEGDEPSATGKAEYHVHFVCGEIPGRPSSPYAPPAFDPNPMPNTNSIGID